MRRAIDARRAASNAGAAQLRDAIDAGNVLLSRHN
jgi:hypothetical protein